MTPDEVFKAEADLMNHDLETAILGRILRRFIESDEYVGTWCGPNESWPELVLDGRIELTAEEFAVIKILKDPEPERQPRKTSEITVGQMRRIEAIGKALD